MEYKYTGIILNKRDVGETDRIYTSYTLEGGKIRSLAKGIRKPEAKLASSLENITLADITIVRTKGLGKITGSIIENSFPNLKNDCDTLLEVFSSIGVFDKLVDLESADDRIFNLLKEYFEVADICARKNLREKHQLLRLGFMAKFMFELGYAVGVDSCAACGSVLSRGSLGFSSKHGGVLCEKCACGGKFLAIPISVNAVKIMRLFLRSKMSSLYKIQALQKDLASVRIAIEDFSRWNM